MPVPHLLWYERHNRHKRWHAQSQIFQSSLVAFSQPALAVAMLRPLMWDTALRLQGVQGQSMQLPGAHAQECWSQTPHCKRSCQTWWDHAMENGTRIGWAAHVKSVLSRAHFQITAPL